MVRRQLWLTPYMGSMATRRQDSLIFPASTNRRMLSMYSLKGYTSRTIPWARAWS